MTSMPSDAGSTLLAGRRPIEVLIPIATAFGRQEGLAVGASLARTWGLPVRLLHVALGDRATEMDFVDIIHRFRHRHPDLAVSVHEVDGRKSDRDPVAGIVDNVGDGSLIVLASERASQWLDGPSVAEAVLHASKGTVVLLGPNCVDPPIASSVVVALDGSARAEAALGPAVAIASAWGTQLWLVTALPEAMRHTSNALAARDEELAEAAYLRTMVERLAEGGIDATPNLVYHDEPIAGIATFATEVGAAMIAASSHGETGIARRLFGSVCMGLVAEAEVPILVVKTGVLATSPPGPADG